MTAKRPTARSLRVAVAAAAVAAACTAVPSQAATADQSCDTNHAKITALAAPVMGQTFTAKLDPLTRIDIPLAFTKPYSGDLELRVSVHLPTDAALVSVNQVLAVSTVKLKATKPGVQWVTFPFDPPVATTTRDVVGAYTLEISIPDVKQELTPKPPVFGWVTCGKEYDTGKPFWRAANFIGAPGPAGVTELGSNRVMITDVPDLQFRSWTV